MVLSTPQKYQSLIKLLPKTTEYTITGGIKGDYVFKHTVYPEPPILLIRIGYDA